MAYFANKELFERIISEKFEKGGLVGVDPADVRHALDHIGNDYVFMHSAFSSPTHLKNTLNTMLPKTDSTSASKPTYACFAVDVHPSIELEYIDQIYEVVCRFFDGAIVLSVNFDESIKGKEFKILLMFG